MSNLTLTVPDLTYWKIDECAVYFDRIHVCGWCHVPGSKIATVHLDFSDGTMFQLASFGLSSADVDAYCGPGASNVRFDEWIAIPAGLAGKPFQVRCSLPDGRTFVGRDALTNAAWGDPYFNSWERFLAMLPQFPSGKVLEIGSRARSAITRRHRIPSHLEYLGVDILPGPNVDLIADVHDLGNALDSQRFVAVFSTSVFEHLAMPWKVVLELNRALVCGGIIYTATHQTFPMHEEPWDFWRYSQHSWRCLFNQETGYEVLETFVGEPARIHPCRTSENTRDVYLSPAWLGAACISRKVSDTLLSWPVPMSSVTAAMYPSGALIVPPSSDPV